MTESSGPTPRAPLASPASAPAPSSPSSPSSPASAASFVRRALPIAVSGGLLVYLAATIDLRSALAYVSLDTALRFAGPLLVWNGATLLIEAHCLHLVTAAAGRPIGRATAARIKSACYLLGLIHYAAGVATLSLLLRRRTGSSLGEAASSVSVIAILDVGSVAGMAVVAGAFLPAVGGVLRTGLLLGFLAALVAGFLILRTPLPLGPLDRIRTLEILRGIRTVPAPTLARLVLLRVVFVACFVGLIGGLFHAFRVEVPIGLLALDVAALLLVSALPIAVAGIGTAQVAFVTLFAGRAPESELLSMSILLSLGITVARTSLGLFFARELTREAIADQSSIREASTRSSRADSRRR